MVLKFQGTFSNAPCPWSKICMRQSWKSSREYSSFKSQNNHSRSKAEILLWFQCNCTRHTKEFYNFTCKWEKLVLNRQTFNGERSRKMVELEKITNIIVIDTSSKTVSSENKCGFACNKSLSWIVSNIWIILHHTNGY